MAFLVQEKVCQGNCANCAAILRFEKVLKNCFLFNHLLSFTNSAYSAQRSEKHSLLAGGTGHTTERHTVLHGWNSCKVSKLVDVGPVLFISVMEEKRFYK